VLDEAGIRFPFCSDLNLSFPEARLRISARGPTRRFERGRRNARNRRNLAVAARTCDGPFTMWFADLHRGRILTAAILAELRFDSIAGWLPND
jgi:hypothetical protein